MKAHEPAMPAAAADNIEHDTITEVRDYLEWLLQRKGLIPRPEPSRADPGNPAKGDGGESS